MTKVVGEAWKKYSQHKIVKALKDPKSGWQTSLLVAITAFAYFFRARQYLLKPQLFAEDGTLWLAEGHNKNVTALLQPVNGFYHFPERLFGYITAHLPLQFAPLIFVVTAWLLFIGMVYYLLSPRTKIFTNNYERIFIVLTLCIIGNIYELFFNFSNSAFLLGVIGILIVTASRSRHRVVTIIEKTVFLLTCLTLPFAWFFLPVTLFDRYKYKNKENFFVIASAFGTVAQLLVYITSHVSRSPVTLQSLISKYTLLEIYNQMLIPAVRFTRIDFPILEFSTHLYPVLTVFLSVSLLAVATILVLRKSNKQVIYLLFFLSAMTFASIKSPTVNVPHAIDAIKHMAIVKGASRYFVYGIVGINIVFVKASYQFLSKRGRYFFMIGFISFGIITSLHYQTFYLEKNFVDYTDQYNSGIKQFESGKVNHVQIPVNPVTWHMYLDR